MLLEAFKKFLPIIEEHSHELVQQYLVLKKKIGSFSKDTIGI